MRQTLTKLQEGLSQAYGAEDAVYTLTSIAEDALDTAVALSNALQATGVPAHIVEAIGRGSLPREGNGQ